MTAFAYEPQSQDNICMYIVYYISYAANTGYLSSVWCICNIYSHPRSMYITWYIVHEQEVNWICYYIMS